MTLTEIQRLLVRAVRVVRSTYRRADTAGERLERELDRLIKRKRLLQPNDLETAAKLYNAFFLQAAGIDKAFKDAYVVLNAPIKP